VDEDSQVVVATGVGNLCTDQLYLAPMLERTIESLGQIKEARGFRRFQLRGLDKVRGEWALIATAHNLLKLHKAA
jgi:hypothetical protein